MPYIITTTTRRGPEGATKFDVTRRAVATLDEAREEAWDAYSQPDDVARETLDALAEQVFAITEQGGTIGPLPDGTRIEVETATWDELADDAGTPLYPAVVSHSEIIDAYNAEHGG